MFEGVKRFLKDTLESQTCWSALSESCKAPMVSFALFGTLVGYLILFGDGLSEYFKYENFSENRRSPLGLEYPYKLYLAYFGFLSFSVASVIFRFSRPHTIRNGPKLIHWVDYAMKYLTVADFITIKEQIQIEGHFSRYGKFYDDDWEIFLEDATWKQSGRTHGMNDVQKRESRKNMNFDAAKKRHSDLLHSMLIDQYMEYDEKMPIRRRLTFAFLVSGYVLLGIPSFDLLLTVILNLVA